MTRRPVRTLIALALGCAALAPASAQDPRLGMRLDAPTHAAIRAIIDSARAQGIPEAPLIEKMYQGAAMGADGPRIVVAVRNLAIEMASAHKALGTVATADEIKAAASAMHAGVPAVELGKMKKQSGGLRRSLALPFIVLTDIVSRGVPVTTAANAIRSLVGAGARDEDINKFQRDVKVDIDQGAPPAAAAETRARGAVPTKPDTGKPEQD
jgi:hypothetical protein